MHMAECKRSLGVGVLLLHTLRCVMNCNMNNGGMELKLHFLQSESLWY